ncbi:MAG: LytTR family transcriptional regulator [Alphaproteobacteria bacterium]|nr:LytTR family transcriptional regulator [Alphaproteobacteria bacterium]
MLDEWLNPLRRGLRNAWQVAGSVLLIGVAALGLLLIGPQNIGAISPPQIAYTLEDDIDFRRLLAAPDDWIRAPSYAVADLDTPGWIYWQVPDEQVAGDAPLAVALNGPFSAEVYWNAHLIGTKGTVISREGERAGPIDALIAIPAARIASSNNRLLIRLISTRAGYEPAVLVQNLGVVPYSADERRSLRYYLPALSLIGVILALIVVLVRLLRERNDPNLGWLIAALSGLMIADLAEISRALVNYPYSWHQPRQAIAMLGLFLFGSAVLGFVQARWPLSRLWTYLIIAAGLAGLLASFFSQTGYDARAAYGLAWLMGLTALSLVFAGRKEHSAWAGLPILLIALAYLFTFPGDFLDRAVYVLGTLSLGLMIWRHRDALSPLLEPEEEPKRLLVQASGEQISVPLSDIAYLKAAGNYTEIHRRDGRWHLDNRSLKTLLDSLPDDIVRIHRSHAAPLAGIERLTATEGSRYRVILDTGTELAVSRSQVADIRARLR